MEGGDGRASVTRASVRDERCIAEPLKGVDAHRAQWRRRSTQYWKTGSCYGGTHTTRLEFARGGRVGVRATWWARREKRLSPSCVASFGWWLPWRGSRLSAGAWLVARRPTISSRADADEWPCSNTTAGSHSPDRRSGNAQVSPYSRAPSMAIGPRRQKHSACSKPASAIAPSSSRTEK
jgi:hypothetical protein